MWCALKRVLEVKMGRTSSSVGNVYKNPVDSYRKQLGRNEERRTTLTRRKRKKRASESEYRTLSLSKNDWNKLMYFLILVALIAVGYALVWAGAGGIIYSLIYDDPVEKVQRT